MTYASQIKVLVIALFHTEDYTVPTIYIVYLWKYVLILKYYKKLGRAAFKGKTRVIQLVAWVRPADFLCGFVACGSLKYQIFNK